MVRPQYQRAFYTLNSENSSLIVDCRGNVAAILYWGARLDESTSPDMIAALAARQPAPARPADEAPIALSPEAGMGFPGSAGIQVHRNGRRWGVHSTIQAITQSDQHKLTIESSCDTTEIRITHRLRLDYDSNVLIASTEITNTAESNLSVEFCGAPSIPIPLRYDKILGFKGRWANEFQLQTIDRFIGSYLRENRAGRTSHDTFPGVVLQTSQTNESRGSAYALHLGWSGNHRLRVEEMSDGRAYAQLGELLFPGELSLAPGESYRSPNLFGVHTDNGLTHVSQCFHRYVRTHLTAERMRDRTRPVLFNSWEALYFDLSFKRLCELADAAADVGAERFVLDDGWFRNRRSDKAGLGDWYVDETVFPGGLEPLISHVNASGMQFGLWVEPESVSPDSDLYRLHPDWVLHAAPAPRLLSRNQLVLDLTRQEVRDYLFERLDALLCEYNIDYLKWDMNRDLSQPGGHDGRAVSHYQTLEFYDLLARVRDAHPGVHIESCSSGGARADFGVLNYTDRIWTSDNNDALDRLRIQKGFSFFFPAEYMGAHVGPRVCHTTGRNISLATRAGVALFGDMGIEANLLEFSDEERAELKAAIALHKRHRDLIFSGDLFRLDRPEFENAFGIVSADKREALFSYAVLDSSPGAPRRLRFRGLSPDRLYNVTIVWPLEPLTAAGSPLDDLNGRQVSGAAMMSAGLQLPTLPPETLLVFYLAHAS